MVVVGEDQRIQGLCCWRSVGVEELAGNWKNFAGLEGGGVGVN